MPLPTPAAKFAQGSRAFLYANNYFMASTNSKADDVNLCGQLRSLGPEIVFQIKTLGYFDLPDKDQYVYIHGKVVQSRVLLFRSIGPEQ